MKKLLVILFIIKLYARNIFTKYVIKVIFTLPLALSKLLQKNTLHPICYALRNCIQLKTGTSITQRSIKSRSRRPWVSLGKPRGVLRCSQVFLGVLRCSQLLCNFIAITLWHGTAVNLRHFFRRCFTKNTSGWLLLTIAG